MSAQREGSAVNARAAVREPTREQVEQLADLACEIDGLRRGFGGEDAALLALAVETVHLVSQAACARLGYDGIYEPDEDDLRAGAIARALASDTTASVSPTSAGPRQAWGA